MNQPRETRQQPPRGAPASQQRGGPQQQQRPPQQAEEPPPRLQQVQALVKRRMKPTMLAVLPKSQDVDRWAQVFLSAITANPDLVRCTDASIARALMHSAEVQLMPGGAQPHCYLIPYWNPHALGEGRGAHEVQFQISVWGYVELVRRAGVKKVWADVVRQNDEFECISGTEGKQIIHKPNWFASEAERGPIIGAYACATLENDEVVFEPASLEDIETARKQNKGRSPAWENWYEQMAQKVAIKRLQKYLPKGQIPDRALELDEDPSIKPIMDVPGFEVPPAGGVQSALDDAVNQARAEKAAATAANGNAPPEQRGQATIDRQRLHSMLCELDERWRGLRGRIDGWDEMQALSAAAYVNAVMRSDGTGTLPEEPAHLKLDDASEVIS